VSYADANALHRSAYPGYRRYEERAAPRRIAVFKLIPA
jgi:hypothetical protein